MNQYAARAAHEAVERYGASLAIARSPFRTLGGRRFAGYDAPPPPRLPCFPKARKASCQPDGWKLARSLPTCTLNAVRRPWKALSGAARTANGRGLPPRRESIAEGPVAGSYPPHESATLSLTRVQEISPEAA